MASVRQKLRLVLRDLRPLRQNPLRMRPTPPMPTRPRRRKLPTLRVLPRLTRLRRPYRSARMVRSCCAHPNLWSTAFARPKRPEWLNGGALRSKCGRHLDGRFPDSTVQKPSVRLPPHFGQSQRSRGRPGMGRNERTITLRIAQHSFLSVSAFPGSEQAPTYGKLDRGHRKCG